MKAHRVVQLGQGLWGDVHWEKIQPKTNIKEKMIKKKKKIQGDRPSGDRKHRLPF